MEFIGKVHLELLDVHHGKRDISQIYLMNRHTQMRVLDRDMRFLQHLAQKVPHRVIGDDMVILHDTVRNNIHEQPADDAAFFHGDLHPVISDIDSQTGFLRQF